MKSGGQSHRGQKPGNSFWCFSVPRKEYLSPSKQQGPSWVLLVQNPVAEEAVVPGHPLLELEVGAGATLLLGRRKDVCVCVTLRI